MGERAILESATPCFVDAEKHFAGFQSAPSHGTFPATQNTFQANTLYRYRVMHSDGNSFRGDVLSGSFNKTSWDEDNIFDQIYRSKCARIIIMMILILYNIYTNTTALKPNFMSSLVICAVFL